MCQLLSIIGRIWLRTVLAHRVLWGFESSRVSDTANHYTSLCKDSDAQEVIPTVTIPLVRFAEGSTDGLDEKEGLNLYGGQQSDVTDCPEFSMSMQQLGSNFGCIPLAPILLYQGTHRVWQNISEVLQAHGMIRDSGIPNFSGLCIPVNTNLKISSWRAHLCDYFDKQLVDLIEFGFTLDFDRISSWKALLLIMLRLEIFRDMWTNTCKRNSSFKPFWDLLITLLLTCTSHPL